MNNSFFNKLVNSVSTLFSSSPSIDLNNISSKIKYITKNESPEDYAQFLKTIKSTIGQGGDAIAIDKLKRVNVEIVLSLDDWLAMYLELYNSSPSNKMLFKVDPREIENKNSASHKVSMFLDTLLFSIDRAITEDFDVNSLQEFLNACVESKLIAAVSNNNEISTSKIITKIDSILKDVSPLIYIEKHKNLTSLKTYLIAISQEHTKTAFDSLVHSIAPKNNLFTSLEEKRSFIHYDNFKLNLKQILDKSSVLDDNLLIKVKSIVSLGVTILDNDWQSLSVEEKHKFKVTIEQDLPTLIINYLSLPENLRNTLVEKDTQTPIKQIVLSSFEKIYEDFCLMDKSNLRQEASFVEIQKTAKYLTARN